MPSYNNNDETPRSTDMKKWIAGGVALGSLAALGFLSTRYRVAKPSQYLVQTGLGIKNMTISKSCFELPWRTLTRVDLTPKTYSIVTHGRSDELQPFKMTSAWTIGPEDNPEAIEKYAKFLHGKDEPQLKATIEFFLQGEVRNSTSNIPLNVLRRDRVVTQNQTAQHIVPPLAKLGLMLHTSNFSELVDDDGHTFISDQEKRSANQVAQKARADVSESIKKGNIAQSTNEMESRVKLAELETIARKAENRNAEEVASSEKDLAVARTEYKLAEKMATIEAQASAEQRNFQRQEEVETSRAQQELQKQRATDYIPAKIRAEIQVELAKANATTIELEAKGKAAAMEHEAKGQAAVIEIIANAKLIEKEKEAAGILAVKNAEAAGYQALVDAAGGDVDAANKVLMINGGTLEKLAEASAEAVREMKPNVNVWNTGSQTEGPSKILTDLFKTGIPLFKSIQQQTGLNFLKPVEEASKQPDSQMMP
jgi:flotillin